MTVINSTPWICLAILIVTTVLLTNPVTAAAPFSFSVSPLESESAPGGSVIYTIDIQADPGFNNPISFFIKINAVGYRNTVDIGTYTGPYPKTITYKLDVPPQAPAGVSVMATVTGMSGSDDQVSQTLNLRVTGQGGPVEGVTAAVTSAINSILQALGLL
jgi:hypothetical protein